MKLHVKYFKENLGKLHVDELWVIIEELLSPHPNAFDKKSMNYDEVLELAVVLKARDELFKNLEQVDLIQHEPDSTK